MIEYRQTQHARIRFDFSADRALLATPALQNLLALELCEPHDTVDIELRSSPAGLVLTWWPNNEKPIQFHLDFVQQAKRLRSFPAPKQGAFNQALGNKTRHVIDATGGWGADAFLMCQQGYQVTVLERNPLMAVLLTDTFGRLANSQWAFDNHVVCPTVQNTDAIEHLKQRIPHQDCVYLDPMFPPKRKQSAAVNKYMRFLKWWAGADLDAAALVKSSLAAGYPRIAVKRPVYAEPLVNPPQTRFSSKLVHYDVYLNK